MGIFHLVMSPLALVNFTDHFREISIKICRILKQKFGCFDFVPWTTCRFSCVSVTRYLSKSKAPILDPKLATFPPKKRHDYVNLCAMWRYINLQIIWFFRQLTLFFGVHALLWLANIWRKIQTHWCKKPRLNFPRLFWGQRVASGGRNYDQELRSYL